MGTSSEENVLWVGEQSGAQPSQDFVKDHPSLLRATACFHTHSSREKSDEDLSPLLHENVELNIEHSCLLLRNSELLSQTLLLKLENQRLKEQLEWQLQKMHMTASSSGSSLLSEEDSSDSDNEEFMSQALQTGLSEVKLAPASDDTHSP